MRSGQFEGRMSRSAWKAPGVVERRHFYYGKGRIMALNGLILILLGLAVLAAVAIGVAVIVTVVVIAAKKKTDKTALDNRDQPPGY